MDFDFKTCNACNACEDDTSRNNDKLRQTVESGPPKFPRTASIDSASRSRSRKETCLLLLLWPASVKESRHGGRGSSSVALVC